MTSSLRRLAQGGGLPLAGRGALHPTVESPRMTFRIALALVLSLLATGVPLARGGPRLYVTAFQRGEVVAVDLDAGRVVHRFPVEDGAGVTGMGLSPDGRRLYLLDGSGEGRLRVLDTARGAVLAEHVVQDRALMLGGTVMHLTADGRWLFANTYDYGAAASGVRVLDVRRGAFLPVGLRDRPAPSPQFVSAPSGALFGVAPQRAWRMSAPDGVPDFQASVPVDTGLPALADAVATRDGRDLYLLEFAAPESSWRLARWRGGDRVETVDLHARLGRPREDRGGSGCLAVSPDGRLLAVARGDRAWLLKTDSLEPVRTVTLDDPADALAFRPDGSEALVLLHSGALLRVPVSGGSPKALTGLLPTGGAPFEMLVGPSP